MTHVLLNIIDQTWRVFSTQNFIKQINEFCYLIRYFEKNIWVRIGFSDMDGFDSIIQIPIKYMLFFVRNVYGSVQIFRTQIKLDKHKNNQNTKNIQNLNKYPKNQKILKRPKIILEIWPRNQKNTQNCIWIPKNIFLKFEFLLEIQNYNRKFKPKTQKYMYTKNISKIHKYI